MAKTVKRLTALQVNKITNPGWYPDGNGLYLQVSPSNTKSWVYRYSINGKERRHGLGPYPDFDLKDARNAAAKCRQLRKEGMDPIEHKKQEFSKKAYKAAKNKTFEECALSYIEAHKSGWKNRKHESQWRNTLETYAYPVIGNISIQDIDVDLVLKVIEPIWNEKTETASRVRQRIENILDWASARKYRVGENPARWRGHLDKLLPRRSKVQKIQHFKAMPYIDLPEYYEKLKPQETITALALAFTILTATRSSEARNATWDEIDLKTKEWNIPEERMKAEKPHRVPLSKEAIRILKIVNYFSTSKYVFPGLTINKPINDSSIRRLLQQDHPKLTVHGFRSTFRDWCAETTSYPREVAEAALAHSLKDKTEAAYQRGDLFKKRIRLMDAWSSYCLSGKKETRVVLINKTFEFKITN